MTAESTPSPGSRTSPSSTRRRGGCFMSAASTSIPAPTRHIRRFLWVETGSLSVPRTEVPRCSTPAPATSRLRAIRSRASAPHRCSPVNACTSAASATSTASGSSLCAPNRRDPETASGRRWTPASIHAPRLASRPAPLRGRARLVFLRIEDLFDPQIEQLGDGKGQRQGRVVLAGLDGVDALTGHTEPFGKARLAPGPQGPQLLQPILQGPTSLFW